MYHRQGWRMANDERAIKNRRTIKIVMRKKKGRLTSTGLEVSDTANTAMLSKNAIRDDVTRCQQTQCQQLR